MADLNEVVKPGSTTAFATGVDEAVEGQVYIDELVTAGVDAAVKVFEPDLATLIALVQNATSFKELRESLVVAYGKMDRQKLATLLGRCALLAQLNGMESVRGPLK